MTIFQLAIQNARTQFGAERKATTTKPDVGGDTHWQATGYGGLFRGYLTAACGKRVPLDDIDGTPTCPICKQEAEHYNSLSIE